MKTKPPTLKAPTLGQMKAYIAKVCGVDMETVNIMLQSEVISVYGDLKYYMVLEGKSIENHCFSC